MYYDGQKKVFTTDAGTVGEVLKRASVNLGPDDLVEPKADTVVTPGYFNINVFRARPVIIYDGDNVVRTSSAFENPKLVVENAGIKVYPEDQYESQVVTDFIGDQIIGQRIVIKRALPVKVIVDGTSVNARTQPTTVAEFLAGRGIGLGEKDTVAPALPTMITQPLTITIARVADVTVTKTESLDRSTQTETDPNMPKGTSKVKSEGSDGHRVVTYRIHYINGIEKSRETLSITDKVDPTPKIIVQGTKVFFAGSIEYWRPVVADAAASNGVDPNLMLAIMKCESNGNANANNGSHFGLYQYDNSTWSGVGGNSSNIFDGNVQIAKTAYKIANYGTSAWAASKYCWGGSY